MASDPSIYNQLGQGVPPIANPLAQAEQGYKLYGQMGQLAAGRAYQQAIDPATGQLDTVKLMNSLAQAPGAGSAIPAIRQSLLAQQKTQLEINAAQLAQTAARTNTVNGALAPLMRLGSNVTPQDVFTTIAGLHASGMPTDEFVQDAATTLPTRQPGMSDQQYGGQLQSWIVNHAARAWPAGVQAEQFTPRVSYQNVGGQMVPVDMNPQTNPDLASSAPLTMGLTPSEKMSQQKGPVGPNGAPTVITGAQYAQQNGLGYLVQGQGGAQGQASPFANGGRLPPALLNRSNQAGAAPTAPAGSIGAGSPGYAPASTATPTVAGSAMPVSAPAPGTPQFITHADARFPAPVAAGAQPPAPQPQPQPVSAQLGAPAAPSAAVAAPAAPAAPAPLYGRPMAVGMGPAQQAAAEGLGKQGQDASGALFAAAQDSPQRQAQLNAMLGDLTKYGSGPNSAALSYARGRLVQLGLAPDNWTEGQSAQENFTKMANQFLAKQAGSMGPVTNDKLALAAESGPNPMFTSLGNQGVLHIAQGNEDALTAKANAWSQAQLPQQQGGQGLTGADYQNWSTQFNQGFMPSAFWYARMAQPERQTLLAGMDTTQQAQLHGAIVSAVNNGWIDPTSVMPAAPAAPGNATPAASAAAPPPAAVPPPAPTGAATPATITPYAVNSAALPAAVGGM